MVNNRGVCNVGTGRWGGGGGGGREESERGRLNEVGFWVQIIIQRHDANCSIDPESFARTMYQKSETRMTDKRFSFPSHFLSFFSLTVV